MISPRSCLRLSTVLLAAVLAFAGRDAAAAVVADSVADFSPTTQGAANWFYGWEAGAIDGYKGRRFERTTQNDGVRWYVSAGEFWTLISATGAHPQGTTTSGGRTATLQVAVRRWVCPSSGTYTVSGAVAHVGGSESDGVSVRIVKGKKLLWSADVPAMGSQTYQLTARIKAGQALDLVLGPGAAGNDISDGMNFSAVIATTP